MKKKIAYSISILSALLVSSEFVKAGDQTNPIRKKVSEALLCKGKSEGQILDVLGEVYRQKKNLATAGISGKSEPGDMEGENKVTLTFKVALDVAGAQCSKVYTDASVSEYSENQPKGFGGHVIAECKGDRSAVIKTLGLVEVKEGVGKYVNPTPNGQCPMTIGLTPLDESHFLLGCGWCSG